MNVSDVKQIATFILVRLGWGAVAGSLVLLGGIYFIVDNSLRGLEKSIDVVNERIGDLRTDISDKIDLKFENLELKLRQEFELTREAIKKAEIDSELEQIPIEVAGGAKATFTFHRGVFRLQTS